MQRGMLSASRCLAWIAIWVTVAILLVWLAVPVAVGVRVREWDSLVENLGKVLYLTFPAVCILLPGMLFRFLPLYCADVFLWCGVRYVLQAEEHRGFRLAMCAVGGLLSVGIVVWYARQAVLLEIREFFVW